MSLVKEAQFQVLLSELWEILLEVRIELQKLLTASNQLPQHDLWPQLHDDNFTDSQRLSADTLTEGYYLRYYILAITEEAFL